MSEDDHLPEFGYQSNIQESIRNFFRYFFPVCKKKTNLYLPGYENEHTIIVEIEYSDFGRYLKSFVLQQEIREIKSVRMRYRLGITEWTDSGNSLPFPTIDYDSLNSQSKSRKRKPTRCKRCAKRDLDDFFKDEQVWIYNDNKDTSRKE